MSTEHSWWLTEDAAAFKHGGRRHWFTSNEYMVHYKKWQNVNIRT